MSSSKVERLAALIDDKTMISSLIREGSDRIRLIEFKDARADIWQFFRLVQLDGQTLPYAVCVRCMKPVSYKAREGTGGLHRHPCSKALTFGATEPIPRGPQRSIQYSKIIGSTLNCGAIDSSSVLQMSKAVCLLPHSPLSANFALNTITNANGSAEDLVASNEFNSEVDLENSVVDALCNNLISFKILNDNTFTKLINHANINKEDVVSALNQRYKSAREHVQLLLLRQTHVTFVVDLWTEEVTERHFVTIWTYIGSVHSGNEAKYMLSTKDVTFASSKHEIIEQVDTLRKNVCGNNKSYVYIFDNNLTEFKNHSHEKHLMCVCHQLHELIKSTIDNNDILGKQINIVLKLCSLKNNLKIATSVKRLENLNSCWFRLEVLKALNDNYDEVDHHLSAHEILIDKNSLNEVCNFFSLLLSAIQTLSDQEMSSTLTLVGLWRAKLEDNCKTTHDNSPLLQSLKRSVRTALSTSQLEHPLYLMAVCLDPRFKKLKMLSDEMKQKTYSHLKNAIANENLLENDDLSKNIKQELVDDTPLDDFETEVCQSKRVKICDTLPNDFNEYLDCCDDSGKDELEIYLRLDVGQMQPLEFWNSEHAHRMPHLRSIAHRLLSIPAVPTYCQFSSSGQEFCIKRKYIDDAFYDQVLFLHIFNKMNK
ncbi:hypothetical protein B4U80_11697 [Leptotrombidium deliense]|uniref:Uncharacterized protein n=1 Tax=Leptotrombidium deliense TaxID=299467 RepID=A0A443S3N2_9ACAR|nr:hypothetical protein B4U80_11697 [Leptotrombidium deliense]